MIDKESWMQYYDEIPPNVRQQISLILSARFRKRAERKYPRRFVAWVATQPPLVIGCRRLKRRFPHLLRRTEDIPFRPALNRLANALRSKPVFITNAALCLMLFPFAPGLMTGSIAAGIALGLVARI